MLSATRSESDRTVGLTAERRSAHAHVRKQREHFQPVALVHVDQILIADSDVLVEIPVR